MLIFTDERDPAYLARLEEDTSAAFGGEGAARLGDPLVRAVLKESLKESLAASNYMTCARPKD